MGTMTDGSQFIDIIIFAMVALFLGLRLRSVLGRRTGHEQPPTDLPYRRNPPPVGPVIDNVVDLSQRRNGPAPEPSPIPGLQAVIDADPTFNPEGFVQGARSAFEMIVSAFAHDDLATLRPLLSDPVFENFRHAIDARKQAGEVCQSELVRIVSAAIESGNLDRQIAQVAVRFVSQQVVVVKDAAGAVVEGDPSRSVQLIDLWTFSRDVRSSNPNWLLVATSSLEE